MREIDPSHLGTQVRHENPNRERRLLTGKRVLLRSTLRNRREVLETSHRKLGWLWRAGPTAAVPPGQRDSDVSRQTKKWTNAGISLAAGVVSGARLSQPSDSNAEERECGLIRSRPDVGGSQHWAERCFGKAVETREWLRVVPGQVSVVPMWLECGLVV